MGGRMTLRGFWVCLLAACISYALPLSAASHQMTSCDRSVTHADAHRADRGDHDSAHHREALLQCCQAVCSACIAVLPPSLAAPLQRGMPSAEAALLPILDGVSVPPILAPPKRLL